MLVNVVFDNMVGAHYKEDGNAGYDSTLDVVEQTHRWLEITQKIRDLIQSCIPRIMRTNDE